MENSPATGDITPSTTTTMSSPALATALQILQPIIAKPKLRSYQTSKETHLPLLQSLLDGNLPGPEIVLLGDSMLERMTTTGSSPNFPHPWPSNTMLDDATLASLKQDRLSRVFNAGVGGDRIQNMAYRLAGGPAPVIPPDTPSGADGEGSDNTDPPPVLPGLLPLIDALGSVKLWVVQAGTNNLGKKGMTAKDREALKMLVRALLGVGVPGCRVLVTGLFYRKDVSRELVDKANVGIRGVVEELNGEFPGEGEKRRLVFLPAAEAVDVEVHLEDHVHLVLEGYRLWVKELFPAVAEMLE